MAFLGFGKKREFVDLSEKYKKQQEKLAEIKEDAREAHSQSSDSGSANGFGFFSSMASASQSSVPMDSGSSEESVNPDERRRVLSKKLSTITEKLEDLSNQIYHLQQRVEVLERKNGVGRY